MKTSLSIAVLGVTMVVGGMGGMSVIAADQSPNVSRLAADEMKHSDMAKALHQLRAARHDLNVAMHDYAGHRAAALKLTTDAIAEVEAGLKAANELPSTPETPTTRPAKPSDQADSTKLMEAAHKSLKKALDDLDKADHKYGVHRETAMDLTKEAMKEVHAALEKTK